MKVIQYLLGGTNIIRVLLSFVSLLAALIILPDEYASKPPEGFQYCYYILIFIVLAGFGLLVALFEKINPTFARVSPMFDQASAAVIALIFILPLIYFVRPSMLPITMLIFIVVFGLVIGKYVYVLHSK